MTVKDVIKNSVYESIAGGTGLSMVEVLLVLVIACVVGVYIYLVYRTLTRSEFYNRDLNVTIAGMCVVVAAIMVAMQSNLLVSFGMVGALSIVRFRTAVKNPIDLLYLFWSISAGIICGVGLYILGLILCIAMTMLIYVLSILPASKAPQLVVIRMSRDADTAAVEQTIRAHSKHSKAKSTMIRCNECELIYEVQAADGNALARAVSEVTGVSSVDVLEHHGEVRA